MSSLEEFQEALGKELAEAAKRQQILNHSREARRARRRRHRKRLLTASAALVIIVVAVVFAPQVADAPPAEAGDPPELAKLAESVEITIEEIINDDGSLSERLLSEYGLEIQFLYVPVDPQLVGQIASVGTITSGPIEPTWTYASDNSIGQILIPAGFQGSLIIEVGRKAHGDEVYIFQISSPLCIQYFGQTVSESVENLMALEPTVRFEMFDDNGFASRQRDLLPEDIPKDFRIIDMQAFSSELLIVTFSGDLTIIPIHPNCQ